MVIDDMTLFILLRERDGKSNNFHIHTHTIIQNMGFFRSMKLVIYFVALVAVIPMIFRKSYPVHSEGIVVITGASTGIGRHAAEYLASAGYTVYCGVRKHMP
jgi:hypothetical protein